MVIMINTDAILQYLLALDLKAVVRIIIRLTYYMYIIAYLLNVNKKYGT